MPFVLDASVSACWLLLDEMDSRADAAFARLDTDQAVAPALWWFEIRNIFIINERRGRLDAADTHRALALLEDLPILIDRAPDDSLILTLARRHRLTVYDAAYLELALRNGLPLATLDAELSVAARAENVELLGA
ncbi:type II toxin-antitoxin system VapC family toxin [Inquilinus sp. YAF38]|jgi:predicted nucleic acid-binding protein|uniref:type II toxin-antitoxin system VapC family toxin n=1 Tax=Inquilinus sp. YAF38 TaxID=3233084 RepID=UPI003F9383CC